MSSIESLENEFQRILENPDNIIVSAGLEDLLVEEKNLDLNEAIFKCSLGEFNISLRKIKSCYSGDGNVRFF